MLTMPATYQTGLPSASMVTIMVRTVLSVVAVVFILTLSFGRSH